MTAVNTEIDTARTDGHGLNGVGPEGCDDITLVVQRALDAYSPDLVARIRARIRAYRTLGQQRLWSSHLRHIEDDYTEKDVRQVLELLVDLGELGCRELGSGGYAYFYGLSLPGVAERVQGVG